MAPAGAIDIVDRRVSHSSAGLPNTKFVRLAPYRCDLAADIPDFDDAQAARNRYVQGLAISLNIDSVPMAERRLGRLKVAFVATPRQPECHVLQHVDRALIFVDRIEAPALSEGAIQRVTPQPHEQCDQQRNRAQDANRDVPDHLSSGFGVGLTDAARRQSPIWVTVH
jgi:hypothetical protein